MQTVLRRIAVGFHTERNKYWIKWVGIVIGKLQSASYAIEFLVPSDRSLSYHIAKIRYFKTENDVLPYVTIVHKVHVGAELLNTAIKHNRLRRALALQGL